MTGVVLRVVARAAIGDDHGAVVPVDPEARRGAARRHDGEHRDLQLHGVVGHGHGEVTVTGHDHALPLLRLECSEVHTSHEESLQCTEQFALTSNICKLYLLKGLRVINNRYYITTRFCVASHLSQCFSNCRPRFP